MGIRFIGLLNLLAWCFVFSGCTTRSYDAAQFRSTKEGTITPQDAGQSTYQYAFSGQILNSVTGDAVKRFTVELAGVDPSVSAVLNALGDRNGMFHVSRNPGADSLSYNTIPIIISASGYEPLVQMLDLGADCDIPNCPGVRPTQFLLHPISGPRQGLSAMFGAGTPESAFSTVKGKSETGEKGIPIIFQELASDGKLDPRAQRILMKSNNRDVVSNMMVILDGYSITSTGALVSGLLAGIKNDRFKNFIGPILGTAAALAPTVADANPQIAAALISVNSLLPYLSPVSTEIGAPPSGKMGQILIAFLQDKSAQLGTVGLITALKSNAAGSNPGAQLAMGTLLPLADSILKKTPQSNEAVSYTNLLSTALSNARLAATLAGEVTAVETKKSAGLEVLVNYLQPLLQAFAGKQSEELMASFNKLVGGKNGIMRLKQFPQNAEEAENYARVGQYLDPVIRGLNSKDGRVLADLLVPMFTKRNPSLSLKAMLSANFAQMKSVTETLYPAMPEVLNKYVPNKQLFSAQLLQGLVNGEFKNLQVTQDLKGASAVIVSGYARDILKMAQLPNVEKIVAVGHAR